MSIAYPGLDASLHRLHTELSTYTERPLPLESIDHYDQAACLDWSTLWDLMTDSFERAHAVTLFPSPQRRRPHYGLTRRALETAGLDNVWIAFSGSVCLRAELRLLRSLTFHANPSSGAADHTPAAILFDVNREPFAYQKATGMPLAYAWRESHIETAAGLRLIPQDAFFDVRYPQGQNPLENYRGTGLVSLIDGPMPSNAFLQRFSATCLGPRLARSGYELASLDGEGLILRPFVKEALHLDPLAIEQRVCALPVGAIASARAVLV